MRDRWFSEAAVCECHVLAIIAKELALSGTHLTVSNFNSYTVALFQIICNYFILQSIEDNSRKLTRGG